MAEGNFGGAMVAHTLRTAAPHLPVKIVTASRGKHVRAEPVSALYEQGKVSHAGVFAELEDQMMLMTTQGYEGGASPDRLDALVWALSELMVDPPNAPRAGALGAPRPHAAVRGAAVERLGVEGSTFSQHRLSEQRDCDAVTSSAITLGVQQSGSCSDAQQPRLVRHPCG